VALKKGKYLRLINPVGILNGIQKNSHTPEIIRRIAVAGKISLTFVFRYDIMIIEIKSKL
jgi:hypothetical protein